MSGDTWSKIRLGLVVCSFLAMLIVPADYLDEFNVHIGILDNSIKTLEKDGSSSDGLDAFFRQVHNLKGISASLQFGNLATQCMKAESFISEKTENMLMLSTITINHNKIFFIVHSFWFLKNLLITK